METRTRFATSLAALAACALGFAAPASASDITEVATPTVAIVCQAVMAPSSPVTAVGARVTSSFSVLARASVKKVTRRATIRMTTRHKLRPGVYVLHLTFSNRLGRRRRTMLLLAEG
jgi:hypothetical protein